MVDRNNGQTEINFEEIEYEIEKNEEKPIKLSSFNKKLSKALKFNLKEDSPQTNLDLE